MSASIREESAVEETCRVLSHFTLKLVFRAAVHVQKFFHVFEEIVNGRCKVVVFLEENFKTWPIPMVLVKHLVEKLLQFIRII